jgi:23S rRNA pseudouridine1911/1915/1917 synthase
MKGFHIVFEDGDLVIVHKGPGLLSVPDKTGHPALSDRLAGYLTAREGKKTPAHPLHRLDKDVSGLLVFAKTAKARDALRKQFDAGVPERTYLAVIRGKMRQPEGTISSYLDTKGDKPRSVAPDQGVPAVTHYRTLAVAADCSLVEVRLETGRKNQIRVHFSEAGRPLLGDRKYGGPEAHGFDRRRIALHAYKLTFSHPVDGRPLVFEDPVPAAFTKLFPGALR